MNLNEQEFEWICMSKKMNKYVWVTIWRNMYEYGNEWIYMSTIRLMPCINRYTWMRHFTYEWGMSHMNEACYISMNNVTYEWVVLRMNMNKNEYECIWLRTIRSLPCTNGYTQMRHVEHEWGMSHMNESCHVWMSHVPNEY